MLLWLEDPIVPTIETPRLILRKMRMSDAQDLFAYSSDPRVAQFVQWSAYTSVFEARAYLRHCMRQYSQGKPPNWGVIDRQTGRLIGTAGYSWVNEDHNSAEIGYSLSYTHWGKGLMTECVAAMLAHGFDKMRLNRIEAQHDVRNPASGRVMEKNGMRLEGVLRGRLRNKGEYVDVKLYAILRKDYEARKTP